MFHLLRRAHKGYGIGLGLIAAGIPTLLHGIADDKKKKKGGGLPGIIRFDSGFENENGIDNHYIGESLNDAVEPICETIRIDIYRMGERSDSCSCYRDVSREPYDTLRLAA